MKIFADHFVELRKRLDAAVAAYNDVAGSLETRLLPMARRFREVGVATEEIPTLPLIERASKGFQAPELTEEPADPAPPALTAVARRD